MRGVKSKFWLVCGLVLALSVGAGSASFAEEKPPEEKPKKFLFERKYGFAKEAEAAKPSAISKFIEEKCDLTVGVQQEYDDNIFLDESDKKRDLKTILTPGLSLEHSWDKAFLGLSHQAELMYYRDKCEWVATQQSNARLSFTPHPKISLGTRNTHLHAGQAEVSGPTGERILRMGYNINTLLSQVKYQPIPKLSLSAQHQRDFIDFSDRAEDDDIDRLANELTYRVDYKFTPKLTCYAGHTHRWLSYNEASIKDFDSDIPFVGFRRKLTRRFTLDSRVGCEYRDFESEAEGSHIDIRTSLMSTLSRFTSFGFAYSHTMGDSSRSEFRQYASDRLRGSFRQYLTSKTILFLSGGVELQRYDDSDRISDTITSDNRETMIYTGDLTLRKILPKGWSAEVGYSYSKRDTDFAKEGHVNNRFRVGFRAMF